MLEIKVDETLFGEKSINVLYFDDEVSQSLYVHSNTTKLYTQENFPDIYKNILNNLLIWQEEYNVKFEIFNSVTGDVKFEIFNAVKGEDFHKHLGLPSITLLDYMKEDSLYYAVSFYKNCNISIEHGLTAIFHKNSLIYLDTMDYQSMIQILKWHEPNSDLWKTNILKKNT